MALSDFALLKGSDKIKNAIQTFPLFFQLFLIHTEGVSMLFNSRQ